MWPPILQIEEKRTLSLCHLQSGNVKPEEHLFVLKKIQLPFFQPSIFSFLRLSTVSPNSNLLFSLFDET